MFDTETFLSTTFTEESSTRREPVPVGEYQATVEAIEPRVTPSGRALLRVTWKIVSPGNEELDGRLVSQTVWLDLTENGSLDMAKGMNIGLGRLRDALSQNTGGRPWQPGMMVGSVARVSVTHRADKENPEILYDEIQRVAKA
jgi:hypothetical protein